MRESVIGHCSYSTGHCSNSPGLRRPLGAGANYCYFLFLLHADHCRPLQSAECVLRAACRPVSWLQSQFLLFVPAAACRGSLLTLEQLYENHLLFVWIHSTVSLLLPIRGLEYLHLTNQWLDTWAEPDPWRWRMFARTLTSDGPCYWDNIQCYPHWHPARVPATINTCQALPLLCFRSFVSVPLQAGLQDPLHSRLRIKWF